MDVVVKTLHGEVRGNVSEGIHVFKGIPYAAPPFGKNRFQPPQLVESWEGIRDALNYGPTVLKPPYFAPFDVLLPEPAIPGEESLNVNIWSPSTEQTGLPVLVWIHGGGFANGSGAVPTYDGSRFARDGVVCVTINYRLGVDGFLFLDEKNVNLGILDQVAALKWVQENIANFGGDPTNVTIAGESAGAMSVGTLLSMPRAKGLFRRAIAESGAGQHVISAATAQRVSQYFVEKLGVAPTAEALATVPVNRLLEAQIELSADVFNKPNPALWGEVAANQMPFEPIVDGEVIPTIPINNIVAGNSAGIDVLVGTNAEEQRLFLVPNGIINHITEETLAGTIAAYGLPVETTLAAYKADRPEASPGDLLGAVVTDWFYRIPAIRLAEAQVKNNSNAFMYEFAWRSPQYNGTLGACHAVEIAFVFDTLEQEGNEPLLGANPPQQLADTMHKAWVSFISTGNPGWTKYDLENRATMRFDTTSEVINDLHAVERKLWEDLR